MVGDELTILVADDDAGRREAYDEWLADHDIRTVTDGEAAVDALGADVDLVLVDRDVPGPSGLALARRLAASPHEPYVVLVGSGARDFDVAAEPVDDYVRRPLEEAGVRAVVETYRTRRDYDAAVEEFYELTAKLAAMEAGRSADALADDERYRRLQWLVDEKRAEVDEALRRSASDWTSAFGSLVPRLPGRSRSPGA